MSEPDYTKMSLGDMVSACQDDAYKWAEAFAQHYKLEAVKEAADQDLIGVMVSWFASAIETSHDVREARRQQKSPWQPMEDAPKDRHILIKRNGRVAIGWWETDRYCQKPKPYWSGTDAYHAVRWAKETPPDGWMELPKIVSDH